MVNSPGALDSLAVSALRPIKHVNSGEGGILITDNADMAAKRFSTRAHTCSMHNIGACLLLKCLRGGNSRVPNYSMRMSNLSSCLLRDQLNQIPERARIWNERYHWLESSLNQVPSIVVPVRDPGEEFVGSSIQCLTCHSKKLTELSIAWQA